MSFAYQPDEKAADQSCRGIRWGLGELGFGRRLDRCGWCAPNTRTRCIRSMTPSPGLPQPTAGFSRSSSWFVLPGEGFHSMGPLPYM